MTEQNDTGDTPPEDTLMQGGPTSGNPEQVDPAEESLTPDMTPNTHNAGVNLGDISGVQDASDFGPDGDASSQDEGSVDPFDALLAERDSLKDQLLRALADVENMRRRTEREMETARKYSHTGFSRDLVGAIDNLSRAIDAAPAADEQVSAETIGSLITGLELSWSEIQSTMERHGIRQVKPLGEKFDYNFHQAMFEVPTAEQEPGTVVEVVQHGYVLHERLLRPAMVGVAKAPATDPPPQKD